MAEVVQAAPKRAPSMAARRRKFLKVLAETANVSRAVRLSGLPSTTAYRLRAKEPAFARAWEAAVAEALDDLEDALIARVKKGVAKPIFYGGEKVGSVTTYSDALAMFVLKARRPEIYNRPPLAEAPALPAEPTQEEARAEVMRRMRLLAEDGEDRGA